ncbi:hypothetical protein H311_02382 [Anncaliia algerae PRA109]|nr:hypothetical protein H311_02382 [Anncaliia algerae PRA109]
MLIILVPLCLTRSIEKIFHVNVVGYVYNIINTYEDPSEFFDSRMENLFSDLRLLLDNHFRPLNHKLQVIPRIRKNFNLTGNLIMFDKDDFQQLKENIINNIDFIIREYNYKCFDQMFINHTKEYFEDSFKVFYTYFMSEYNTLGMDLTFLKMVLNSTINNLFLNDNFEFCMIIKEDFAKTYNPYFLGYIDIRI